MSGIDTDFPRVVKYAAVTTTGADNTIVAAITAKKIRVLNACLYAAPATKADLSFVWESGTAGNDLSGVMSMDVSAGDNPLILPFSQVGWFETVAGELLNIRITAGTGDVTGHICYAEIGIDTDNE